MPTWLPSRNHKHSIPNIFLFDLQDQDFLLSACQKSYRLGCCQNHVDGKKVERSKETAKHMKNMTAHQPEAHFNQVRHQRGKFVQYKKKGKKRKLPHLTGQSQAPLIQKQQHNKLPQKYPFKPPYAHIKSQYKTSNKAIICSKCGDTKTATRTNPVPSLVIPNINLVSTLLPEGISVKTAKGIDISQVSVSVLIPGRCELTFI